MHIQIETDSDTAECDCCGTSYATGGTVLVDGQVVLERPAEASCIGSLSFTPDELLVMALHKLGHTVLVDGDRYHVTRVDEEYHGVPG